MARDGRTPEQRAEDLLDIDWGDIWDDLDDPDEPQDYDPRAAKHRKERQGMQVSNRSMKRVQNDLHHRRRDK